jgi:phosphoglycolate phosphatase
VTAPSGLRALVFDFDLTLADSRDAFIACYEHASGVAGLPPPAPEQVLRLVGTPLHLAIEALYPDASESNAASFTDAYQSCADEVMVGHTRMLEGVPEALYALRDAGLHLAIVSQKLRRRVTGVLEREGLLPLFDAVLGGEDAPFKPDPAGILLALDRLGCQPSEALYVGDTVIDADAARRAEAGFIALLSGVTKREDFEPYAPLAILEGVWELPSFLGVAMRS